MAVATACGQEGQSQNNSPRTTIDVSRAKTYHALKDLAPDSEAVVTATATGQTAVEDIGSIPFTVRSVTVTATFKGQVGPTIKVRQVGGGEAPVGHAPLMTEGQTYVLFLQQFQSAPGKTSEQYVVTGASAGLYQLQGGIWAHRLDDLSTDLPSIISLDALRTQIGTA